MYNVYPIKYAHGFDTLCLLWLCCSFPVPFRWYWLTVIPTWVRNYMPYKVGAEITCANPFPKLWRTFHTLYKIITYIYNIIYNYTFRLPKRLWLRTDMAWHSPLSWATSAWNNILLGSLNIRLYIYLIFYNLQIAPLKLCEWISNFILRFIMDAITYPCWD